MILVITQGDRRQELRNPRVALGGLEDRIAWSSLIFNRRDLEERVYWLDLLYTKPKNVVDKFARSIDKDNMPYDNRNEIQLTMGRLLLTLGAGLVDRTATEVIVDSLVDYADQYSQLVTPEPGDNDAHKYALSIAAAYLAQARGSTD